MPTDDEGYRLSPEQLAGIERTVAALPPLPDDMRRWLGLMLGGGPAGPAPTYPRAHSCAHSQPATRATHATHATP